MKISGNRIDKITPLLIVRLMNFNPLLQNYISDNTKLAPITKTDYENKISRFLSWLEENKISDPEKKDVLEFQKTLFSRDNKKNLMSPASANSYMVPIKRFFAYLDKNDLYKNIASSVELEKVEKKHRKDPLDLDETRNLLLSIKEHYDNEMEARSKVMDTTSRNWQNYERVTTECKLRDSAIGLLATHTGLRLIEIVRANVEDIRIQKVRIEDRQLKKHCLYIQGKGKSTKDDFVYLQEWVYSAIIEYLNCRYDNKKHILADPLFIGAGNRSNARISPRTISKFFKMILRDSGIINAKDDNDKRLSFHSLRHTAATLALDLGVPIEKVRQMLRHAQISTTEIYTNGMERMIDPAEFGINLGEN